MNRQSRRTWGSFVGLLIVAVFLALCSSSCGRAGSSSTDAACGLQAYLELNERINQGQGYANHLQTIGYLSWREALVLDSYLNVYEYTQDIAWLENFVQQADLVLIHRDDYLYGGDPVWSTLKYLADGWPQPEGIIIDNAMIAYPFARFSALVKPNSDLHATFLNVALWYEQKATETVRFFDDQYQVAGDHGAYRSADAEYSKHPGAIAPVNWQAAMGKVLLALYDVTGNQEFLDRAAQLARTIKQELESVANGSYRWHYWIEEPSGSAASAEDISHGAIDVQFAVMAHDHGLVFDEDDMMRFGATLILNSWNGVDWTSSVWGDGNVISPLKHAAALWVDLARFVPNVAARIQSYIDSHPSEHLSDYQAVLYMWSISRLLSLQELL